VIRPNELTNPGERAAYARVDALFEAIDRFSEPELLLIPGSDLDDEAREALRAEIERLADRLGRRELYDTALEHVRNSLLTRAVAEFRGSIGGIGFSPAHDPERQAAAITAVSDALAIAVVEDQLSLADVEAFAGPARRVLGIDPTRPQPTGPSRPGGYRHASHVGRRAVSEHEAPAGEEPARETTFVGAPSVRDWAEADHGATALDRDPDLDEPTPGRSPTTRIVLGIAGIGLALGVLVAGVAGGTAALVLAGAVALVAVVASLRMREPADD
jgi:hypothetical protein